MSIKIWCDNGARMHTYGYGKHTSYADKIKKHGVVSKKPGNGILLTNITLVIEKTVVVGDKIWEKIKCKIFKDDHTDKNYRR